MIRCEAVPSTTFYFYEFVFTLFFSFFGVVGERGRGGEGGRGTVGEGRFVIITRRIASQVLVFPVLLPLVLESHSSILFVFRYVSTSLVLLHV